MATVLRKQPELLMLSLEHLYERTTKKLFSAMFIEICPIIGNPFNHTHKIM